MYGVVGTGALSAGDSLYDLLGYFTKRTYTGAVDQADETFSFLADWNDMLRVNEHIECTGVGNDIDEPAYQVSLFVEGNEIVLAHGWQGVSYHEDYRWRLGSERQITHSLGGPGSYIHSDTLGVRETLTSVNDIRQGVERRLQQVFGRLADARHAGRLALGWGDVAAALAQARDFWVADIQPGLGILAGEHMWVQTSGRNAPLELQLADSDGRQVAALRAEHTPEGWVLSEFYPHLCVDGCSWYTNLVICGDHRDPGRRYQCAHFGRHSTLHAMTSSPVDPWGLKPYIAENWPGRLHDADMG